MPSKTVRAQTVRARARRALLCLVLLAGACGDSGGGDRAAAAGPRQYETLDGSTASLDALRGRPVVVNFFASWCLECRLEHPDLVASSDTFGPTGVTFVQIGYQERPQDSSAWLDDVGRSDHTLYLHDPGSRTAIAYGVFGIPETFFIDPEGTVVGKIIGEADALILGATIDSIRNGEQPGQQITGDTQQRPDA